MQFRGLLLLSRDSIRNRVSDHVFGLDQCILSRLVFGLDGNHISVVRLLLVVDSLLPVHLKLLESSLDGHKLILLVSQLLVLSHVGYVDLATQLRRSVGTYTGDIASRANRHSIKLTSRVSFSESSARVVEAAFEISIHILRGDVVALPSTSFHTSASGSSGTANGTVLLSHVLKEATVVLGLLLSASRRQRAIPANVLVGGRVGPSIRGLSFSGLRSNGSGRSLVVSRRILAANKRRSPHLSGRTTELRLAHELGQGVLLDVLVLVDASHI